MAKKSSGKMVSHPGNAESVTVAAHVRKKPVRDRVATNVLTTAQHTHDDIADNAFASTPEVGEKSSVSGLAGEPKINHLKAAVGLLSRRRV